MKGLILMRYSLYFDRQNDMACTAALAIECMYGKPVSYAKSDVIIVLGGDGTMLNALNVGMKYNKPIFGMNLGRVGAYLNKYAPTNLEDRIESATSIPLSPLCVQAQMCSTKDPYGPVHPVKADAWNEIYLSRGSNLQQAHLNVSVSTPQYDKNATLAELYSTQIRGDGYLVATPIGSRAYNLAANGHPLSFREKLLASTSPCSMVGLNDILPANAHIHIEVLEHAKRHVTMSTDNKTFKGHIKSADIFQDPLRQVTLLWDADKIDKMEKKDDILITRDTKIIHDLASKGYFLNHYQREQ